MSKYETAPYKVLEKDGDIEIRLYEGFFTAGVSENKSMDSDGFNQIFSYISGNNDKHEKIPMATPVINDMGEDSADTEFVIPHGYSAETLPKPNDPQVKINKVEGRLAASITFSGSVNENKIESYEQKLKEWLDRREIKMLGNFKLARYNSPFSLPPLRRNEIIVDIQEYK